jgi:hypothetical protein
VGFTHMSDAGRGGLHDNAFVEFPTKMKMLSDAGRGGLHDNAFVEFPTKMKMLSDAWRGLCGWLRGFFISRG